MRIRNVSPLGALDVPLLGAIVESDAVVDVATDHARVLLEQDRNWQPADDEAAALLHAEQIDKAPAGNASRETWAAYATEQGATSDALDGMTRDEIRDTYGPQEDQ